jgi:hypothetical protein
MVRGLFGGSLWLEPSFHGLQWPYMTKTGIGISGSAWVDNGYEQITRESPNTPNTTRWLQQGRAVLRVTPTYASGQFFIQAQAELVANGCQSTGTANCDQAGKGTVDTDDLWLRVGHWNLWDLKVGRFEGWEIYHTGMGLDINTLERRGAQREGTSGNTLDTPDYYGVNFLHDRPQGAGMGYAALHGYVANIFRIEVLGEIGTEAATGDGHNILGVRPAGILDLGWVKLKGGYEYEKGTRGTQYMNSDPNYGPLGKTSYKYKSTRKGYGGAVQFVFAPYAESGLNIATGSETYTGDTGAPDDFRSGTKTSLGGFANFSVGGLARFHPLYDLLVGGGVNWTTRYDNHRASGDTNADYSAHLQVFGALQYLVAKQLFIKAVIAYARADFQPSGATPDQTFSYVMWSGRVRLMYLY